MLPFHMRSRRARIGNARPVAARESTAPDSHDVKLRDHLAANYQHLHRRLQRHLGCADAASECLHDAWLRLHTTTAPSIENAVAYVYRVACNAALDRLRLQRSCLFVGDADQILEQLEDRVPGPDAVIETRRVLEALARAFECLPRRHRDVLLELRIEGNTRQAVADRHRISLRKVDTALRQALTFCAEQAGETVHAGVPPPRRKLSAARLVRRQCA